MPVAEEMRSICEVRLAYLWGFPENREALFQYGLAEMLNTKKRKNTVIPVYKEVFGYHSIFLWSNGRIHDIL